MKTKKKATPQEIVKNSILGIMIVIIGIFIFFASSGTSIPRYVFIFFSVCGVIHLVRLVLAARTINTEKKFSQDKALQRRFYDKCLEYKLTRISTAADVEKAKTIAESVGVPAEAMEDISAYFNAIKADLEHEQKQAHLAAENEQRTAEKAAHAELVQFAHYEGREKRLAMLEAKRQWYLQEAARYRKLYDTGLTIGQQKEIDWATRGGIASGIAGGAAGVAAAADAQIKNAQIRASNAQNMRAMAPVLSDMLSKSIDCEKQAKIHIRYIEQTKTKIVSKLPQEELLRNLTFTEPNITVSSTGAISLELNIGGKSCPKILDVTDGVTDGTVIAQIYEGTKLVGEADLVLPLWGIGTGAWPVKGMCLSGGKPGTKYRVEYKARHLWAMEGQQLIFKLD